MQKNFKAIYLKVNYFEVNYRSCIEFCQPEFIENHWDIFAEPFVLLQQLLHNFCFAEVYKSSPPYLRLHCCVLHNQEVHLRNRKNQIGTYRMHDCNVVFYTDSMGFSVCFFEFDNLLKIICNQMDGLTACYPMFVQFAQIGHIKTASDGKVRC